MYVLMNVQKKDNNLLQSLVCNTKKANNGLKSETNTLLVK